MKEIEVYYCKNESDLRKVSLHILNCNEIECIEEQLELAFVCGCTCNLSEEISEGYCNNCGTDEEELDGRCLLYEMLEKGDKNLQSNIIFSQEIEDMEYPCVVAIHEENNHICSTIVTINEAKSKTKYGC